MAKKHGFIKEFKEFISRGSVIALAVGVIIGGAFQKIVNSLVNDIIMPVISLVTGGIDFNNWFLPLGKGDFATAADAKAAGVATLNYGTFIGTALDFLIMAFIIFLFIKGINALKEITSQPHEEVKSAPTTKICPYCRGKIEIDATRCPNCTSVLESEEQLK